MTIFRWLKLLLLASLSLALSAQAFSAESEMSAEQKDWIAKAQKTWQSIEHKKGNIDLANGQASLNIPDNFYFIKASDADKVLVDIWGNPPGSPVLGMIFPEGTSPLEGDSWAVTVEYSEEGFVSDEDADDIDYDDLLADMQQQTREASKQRVSQGYEAISLVGWASAPYYDSISHKLHWAKEIQFGDSPENTLNYNIRVLGRRGVLVLNFVASMSQLDTINGQLDDVVAMADFNQGSTYAEFDPDIDQVAAYGIGALVAGKVLAKTGLIAGLLILLKKFGVFIVIGIGAFLKKFFGKS